MDLPFREILERYLAARCGGLRPESICHCRMHIRSLLRFLQHRYPQLESLSQLRRSPHIEEWLQALKSAVPPYTCIWDEKLARNGRFQVTLGPVEPVQTSSEIVVPIHPRFNHGKLGSREGVEVAVPS